MAKKQTNNEIDEMISKETIIEKEISQEMEESYLSYAVMTIVERALPDVYDGMKPVQRRILFSMYDLGIKPEGNYKKSARIVGDVIGKWHPHGDGSVYGAMTNLVNDFDIRYPLVNGQGNFGSADGDGPAAMRYTEAKLQKLAMENLKDLDNDAVNMRLNFSEDEFEPEVLPAMVPNLLVNGSEGIATGYTTCIPPHNMIEVCDAIIAQIKNPDITIEELVKKYIKGPDVPTFGYLINNENILKLYKEGTGTLEFRGHITTDTNEENGNRQIVITELPPEMKKSKLVEKLHGIYVASKDKKVLEIRDESEGVGTRIVLELHKTAIPELIINELYKHITKTKSYILRAIVDKTPTLLDLKQIIEYYQEHRRGIVERRTKFNVKKLEKKLNSLQGFKIIAPHIKKVTNIIVDSESAEDAMIALENKFNLNREQSEAILEKKLRTLTKMESDKILKDLEELQKQVDECNRILSSAAEIDKEIIKELNYLKKTYGDERKTRILEPTESETIIDVPVSTDPMFVALTNKNQIKTMPYTAFQDMIKNKSIKEKTNVFVQGLKCTMADNFILILENGNYIRGDFSNLDMDISGGQKIVGIVPFNDSEDVIVMMSQNGLIKKVKINSLKAKNLKMTSVVELTGDDKLIGIRIAQDNETNVITLATKNGIVHRFYLRGFSVTSPTAKPLGCINLDETDKVIDFDISDINNDSEGVVILFNTHVSNNNSWKSMKLDEFIPKNRMAKGVSAIKYLKKDMGTTNRMILVHNDFFMVGNSGEVILKAKKDLNILDKAAKPENIDFGIITSKFLL
jgi:DNA gyrase subunit A